MSQIVRELIRDRFYRIDKGVRLDFAIKAFSAFAAYIAIMSFGEKYSNGREHIFTPIYQYAKTKRNEFFGVPPPPIDPPS